MCIRDRSSSVLCSSAPSVVLPLALPPSMATSTRSVSYTHLDVYKRQVYIETGAWSKKAIAEAKKYGEVIVAASSKDKNYRCV